jgi:outer membrane protein assembly factor BamA
VNERHFGCGWRSATVIANLVFAFLCVAPIGASAQDTPRIPEGFQEPQGFIAEPDPITRAAIFADRHLGKGDLNNGLYYDFGKMVPGAGWLAIGPGYRRWFGKDEMLLDGSVAYSVKHYRTAQARVLLPKLAKSRVALGAQARWVDYGAVDYFGVGPDTQESARTTFGVKATHVVAHATLRPTRWFDIDAEVGLLSPSLEDGSLGRAIPADDQPTFVPTQLSMTLDTRNFREHPTSGLLLRGSAAHYADRDGGAFTHQRYEGEGAGFLPMFGERVVLALHGMVVTTPRESGSVPFYLLPSLGGSNSLRSFTDYRFHDRNMLLTNAELRVALMTHVDLALFTDAGNVAPRFEDLNLDKRSYGAGLRLHTRRATFARVDVANGAEGWRFLFRLTDPLSFGRLERRAAVVPSVP